jgi:hypothetical protein
MIWDSPALQFRIFEFRRRAIAEASYDPLMRRNRQLTLAIGFCFGLTTYAIVAALQGWPAIGDPHHNAAGAFIERFCAYALFGSGLSFFLPGRVLLVCALLVLSSLSIELSQALRPDRYPSVFYAVQQIIGGIVGAVIAQIVLMFLPRPP